MSKLRKMGKKLISSTDVKTVKKRQPEMLVNPASSRTKKSLPEKKNGFRGKARKKTLRPTKRKTRKTQRELTNWSQGVGRKQGPCERGNRNKKTTSYRQEEEGLPHREKPFSKKEKGKDTKKTT